MQDLISVITSMVGKRRAGKVKQEIVEIIKWLKQVHIPLNSVM